MIQTFQNVELKEILNHISELLSIKKIEQDEVKYLNEILIFLKQSKEEISDLISIKLQILNKLMKEIITLQKEGKVLFHSYQSIIIILQLPETFLKRTIIIIDQFVNMIQNEKNIDLSDEEKIVILIDQFFLNKNLKSRKSDLSKKVN